MTFKVIFMGTPEFSVPTLAALRDAGHEIVAVYSQPPRPAGRRGLNFMKSPVHLFAEASDIAVSTPVDWKSQTDREAFVALRADVAVVVAYGLILPKALLTGPRHGCFNLHASLLPRWRGAAPIQRAIMAGDRETGVAVMKMEAGLDTGPVAMTAHIPITPNMTAGELHDRLSVEGASLMVAALEKVEAGDLAFKPQSGEGATYAGKIEKSETPIDWSLSAKQIHDQIRGLSPVPGAWTPMTIAGTPQRVKILSSEPAEGDGKPGEVLSSDLRIACGSGAIRILSVQKAGSRPSCADAFQNGAQIAVGDRIGA